MILPPLVFPGAPQAFTCSTPRCQCYKTLRKNKLECWPFEIFLASLLSASKGGANPSGTPQSAQLHGLPSTLLVNIIDPPENEASTNALAYWRRKKVL
jgi:hypothetical protein